MLYYDLFQRYFSIFLHSAIPFRAMFTDQVSQIELHFFRIQRTMYRIPNPEHTICFSSLLYQVLRIKDPCIVYCSLYYMFFVVISNFFYSFSVFSFSTNQSFRLFQRFLQHNEFQTPVAFLSTKIKVRKYVCLRILFADVIFMLGLNLKQKFKKAEVANCNDSSFTFMKFKAKCYISSMPC